MKFDTFLNTAQEPLRLSIAFQEYFHGTSLSDGQRLAYEAYLKSRRRSVLLQIIKNCDSLALAHFLNNGWMDARLFSESFSLAADCGDAQLPALLLAYQQQAGLSCKMEDIYGDFD